MNWIFHKYGWFLKSILAIEVLVISLMIFENAIIIYIPFILGNILDSILNGTLTTNSLKLETTKIITLSFILFLISFIWGKYLFRNSILLEKLLKGKFNKFVLSRDLHFFNKNKSGDLLTNLNNDTQSISHIMGEGILSVNNIMITTPMYIFAMIYFVDWRLTLVSLIPLPLIAISIHYLGKLINKRASSMFQSFGKMNNHIVDSITGMKVIRSTVNEEKNIDAFRHVSYEVAKENKKLSLINAMFWPSISIIMGVSLAISLIYGTYLIINGTITIGELVTFTFYQAQLSFPMFAFGSLVNTLQSAKASDDRMDQVYQQSYNNENDNKEIRNLNQVQSINFNNLTFNYPSNNTTVLKDISFKILEGDMIGIVGKTGSGKSTLLQLLLKSYSDPANNILVSGIPINEIPISNYLELIGYVPQDHILFSGSIEDNLKYANGKANQEELISVLKLVCLWDEIMFMDQGLRTLIGERGTKLSGGQQQRLSIARALLKDPELLLLDDPLSAVDIHTAEQIINNLKKYRQGKTTILCTHRMEILEDADKIFVLDNGEIIEKGSHLELLNQEGWYMQQYMKQKLQNKLLNFEDKEF
ncbi:ABC transporter ATP-binding protein [Cytobacillus purgationiresistens]|uniref:ATP-binding cassette subfamily B protein n=1 Tax=Cytobacillus purgationiresistens TaxID=863449 RepID=A0ABU0ANT5_9BACI|nr:ABC transporter ATP-binding protein [Cytobacillus purgationiresistens]MDQ0272956.1 ATP-binding cassette subfamily B protein [Cytobacillus purgationiresistens]